MILPFSVLLSSPSSLLDLAAVSAAVETGLAGSGGICDRNPRYSLPIKSSYLKPTQVVDMRIFSANFLQHSIYLLQ